MNLLHGLLRSALEYTREEKTGVSSVFMNQICRPSATSLGYDYQYVTLGIPEPTAMSFRYPTSVMKVAIP